MEKKPPQNDGPEVPSLETLVLAIPYFPKKPELGVHGRRKEPQGGGPLFAFLPPVSCTACNRSSPLPLETACARKKPRTERERGRKEGKKKAAELEEKRGVPSELNAATDGRTDGRTAAPILDNMMIKEG